MPIAEMMLPEFDHEMANSRKYLERVLPEKFDWRPHPKSWTLGQLANHVANLPTWATITLTEDAFDMNPPGTATPPSAPLAKSREALLQNFDRHVTAARAVIAGASDTQMRENWSLLSGGNTIFTMPKIAVLRSFVMNHSIHHRGQLSVYLRMNNISLPPVYGPTADEGSM